MLESDESVPDQIGKQTDIFNLLANCFDMVAPDDPEEGKNLTESLLCVFSGLLKSKENQTRVASAPNIITGRGLQDIVDMLHIIYISYRIICVT